MIARKIKGNFIEIEDSRFVFVESFSFVEIDTDDLTSLLMSANADDVTKIDANTYKIRYSKGDAVDRRYNAIAMRRSQTIGRLYNTNIRYSYAPNGTSVLVRDDKRRIIRIARRNANGMRFCMSVLPITDSARNAFFNECKSSKYHESTTKYGIDSRDVEEYLKWSHYMDDKYLEYTKQKQ